jgi:hypothetical protein
MAMLFRQGALDVFFTPIQMKKNRPAVMLSVLCAESTTKACVEVILRETTSLGVRIFHADRICLERRMLEAETPFGIVPVKAAIYEGQVRSLSPEYDVCRRLCEASGVPLRVVQDAAVDAARGRSDDMG